MVILKYVFFPFSFSIAILLLYKKEIKRFITQTEQKIVHHETDKEIVIKLIYYFHMLHHRGAERSSSQISGRTRKAETRQNFF